MSDLEHKFVAGEKLRKFSEELIAERKAWKAYLAEATKDVEECRKFLREFRNVVTDYKKVMDAFMKELGNIKEFKELVDLNKEVVEALKE